MKYLGEVIGYEHGDYEDLLKLRPRYRIKFLANNVV